MTRGHKERQLTTLNEYIAQAEEIIRSQQRRITRISENGRDATKARALLTVFVETLQKMQARRAILLAKSNIVEQSPLSECVI